MITTGGKQDWQTPRWLFDHLADVWPFALDAASTHENSLLPWHYTEYEDGLRLPWAPTTPEAFRAIGGPCLSGWTFCNPPFKQLALWTQKARAEQLAGCYSVLLAPSLGTCSAWYKAVEDYCHTWLVRPRIAYVGPGSNPNGQTMLLEFGPDTAGHAGELTLIDLGEAKPKRGSK